jgi:hypothetical protein
MAAEGVFGQKIQYDAKYNWGVNIKGGNYIITNLVFYLYMVEHVNIYLYIREARTQCRRRITSGTLSRPFPGLLSI